MDNIQYCMNIEKEVKKILIKRKKTSLYLINTLEEDLEFDDKKIIKLIHNLLIIRQEETNKKIILKERNVIGDEIRKIKLYIVDEIRKINLYKSCLYKV